MEKSLGKGISCTIDVNVLAVESVVEVFVSGSAGEADGE
jgi:hypothetical protein